MRLLTHNMLQCHVKGCTTNNFPLNLESSNGDAYNLNLSVQHSHTEFSVQFLKHMIPKLDWDALITTCSQLNIAEGLPSHLPESILNFSTAHVVSSSTANTGDAGAQDSERAPGADDVEAEIEALFGRLSGEDQALLRKIHEIILETNVMEGKMVCGNCGHVYTIKQGIPNMLLCEDEV